MYGYIVKYTRTIEECIFCTFTLWLFNQGVQLLPVFEIREYFIPSQYLSGAMADIVYFVTVIHKTNELHSRNARWQGKMFYYTTRDNIYNDLA